MPRPRRDGDTPPATQRMIDAFWQLLSQTEYRNITVTDIVREAGVNRNSFYYHFSKLGELADAAILAEVNSSPLANESPDPNDGPHEWREHITEMFATPAQTRRLDRLALLASPNSSPELAESLHDFGRMSLMRMLDRDESDLDLRTDLLIDFAVGGLLSVLKRWPQLRQSIDMKRLMNEDLAVLAMGMYMSMSKEDMLDSWNRIFNKA